MTSKVTTNIKTKVERQYITVKNRIKVVYFEKGKTSYRSLLNFATSMTKAHAMQIPNKLKACNKPFLEEQSF